MTAIAPSSIPCTAASLGSVGAVSAYEVDTDFVAAPVSLPIFGPVTDEHIIEVLPSSGNGWLIPSFGSIFFNRIWIIPRTTDLGNVVAYQEREIEVWNSYFESRELIDIVSQGDVSGLSLTGGIGSGFFRALQSYIYTLQVTPTSAPVINAAYVFEFDDGLHPAYIVGRRVIPFPLRHDWAAPVLEQIGFKTDVLAALSGKEQRIALRKRPRRRVEMQYATMTPKERGAFENLMYGWQGRTFAVPLWQDVSTLTASSTIGATTFYLDTVNKDYEVGGLLYVSNKTTSDVLEITAVTPTSIETQTGALNAYRINTRVAPARLGRLASEVSTDRLTSDVEAMRLAWNIAPEEASTNRLAEYESETYRGYEVYNVGNDYSEIIPITQTLRETLFDSEIGRAAKYGIEPHPRRGVAFKNLISRAELGEFLGWVYEREGKLKPFWFCERVPAFRLVSDELDTSTGLVVESNGYTSLVNVATPRRDIAIKTNGGWIYRRIEDAVDNLDGTETLTLDAELGIELNAADNPQICYLKFMRQNTDTVELAYESTNAIRTATSFIDLLTNV